MEIWKGERGGDDIGGFFLNCLSEGVLGFLYGNRRVEYREGVHLGAPFRIFKVQVATYWKFG